MQLIQLLELNLDHRQEVSVMMYFTDFSNDLV